ncbi:hypothetical protein PLAN_30458 [Planktothrix rubescens CCAP 1459/22]|uniref:Uncharacterized protein n=1 Tax=Planktothrix rubescens CCAP 1459/22 TaxID=329571 RepID=A0A6J7ZKP3_PLARU|nr:hypothetical protein PLAN_30458 [Planktothrix rubescens NIVA-CYA 18]
MHGGFGGGCSLSQLGNLFCATTYYGKLNFMEKHRKEKCLSIQSVLEGN